MSSDESTHMRYNNTTLPAILDMPLAQTPQFTIGCGLHWQGTIFNHGTCPLITVHMLCAQKTSLDRSPRFVKTFHEKKSRSCAHRICSAFKGYFFRLQYMYFAHFLFWRSRAGMQVWFRQCLSTSVRVPRPGWRVRCCMKLANPIPKLCCQLIEPPAQR